MLNAGHKLSFYVLNDAVMHDIVKPHFLILKKAYIYHILLEYSLQIKKIYLLLLHLIMPLMSADCNHVRHGGRGV